MTAVVLGEGADDGAVVKTLARILSLPPVAQARAGRTLPEVIDELAIAAGLPAIAAETTRTNDLSRFAREVRLRLGQERARVLVVLDADVAGAAARWEEFRAACRSPELPLPEGLPPGGVHVDLDADRRLSVWVMPNNRDAGALEDFLLGTVIPADDPILRFVDVQVATLLSNRRVGEEPAARFEARRAAKARLRMWLACQESPALPPGHALLQGVIPVDEARIGLFSAWLRAALAP